MPLLQEVGEGEMRKEGSHVQRMFGVDKGC